MKKTQDIKNYLNEVILWAYAQPDVVALALVGSYARDAAKDCSDIDLVLLTSSPQHYLRDIRWIDCFGTVLRTQAEDYGMLTSVRAWYANGLEVEYGITTPEWAQIPIDPGTLEVIHGGIKILHDKEDLFARLFHEISQA